MEEEGDEGKEELSSDSEEVASASSTVANVGNVTAVSVRQRMKWQGQGVHDKNHYPHTNAVINLCPQ